MMVEQLIERLQEMPPDAQVLVEGAAETFWSVRDLSDDETGRAVIVFVGPEVHVRIDDDEEHSSCNDGGTDGR